MWLGWYNLTIKLTERALFMNEQKKKMISLDGIYLWWRCCEYCWDDNKGLRILYKVSYKVEAEFEMTDSNFKRSSTLGKMLLALQATEKSFMKRRVNWCHKLPCYLVLRTCSHQPQLSATTILISQKPAKIL